MKQPHMIAVILMLGVIGLGGQYISGLGTHQLSATAQARCSSGQQDRCTYLSMLFTGLNAPVLK